MLHATGTCVTGPSHRALGIPGQDALQLRGWRGGWIAAVADGLGSRAHSAVGARLAVQAAQRVARGWPARSWRDVPARQAATDIYRHWQASVPWADKSCAASTLLLLACDADGHARTWQLGDGLVLLRTGGVVESLTPARTGFGNQTQALGVDRSWSAWHTADFALKGTGDMVLLMTDGVADDLLPEALDGFASVVNRNLARRSRRRGKRWLTHELIHWATPLHGDDKTLAAVFKEKR